MKATLLKTTKQKSKYSGFFWYFFFKLENGKSARSCIAENMANFSRWKSLCGLENIELDGITLKGDNLVDADSYPKRIATAQ